MTIGEFKVGGSSRPPPAIDRLDYGKDFSPHVSVNNLASRSPPPRTEILQFDPPPSSDRKKNLILCNA